MTTWRWYADTDKQGVGFDDASFFPANEITSTERGAFYNRHEVAAAVWGILFTARNAFVVGTADYRDACATLTELVKELAKAAANVETIHTDVSAYLSPSAFLKLPKLEDRISLVKEALVKLPAKK